MSDTFPSSNGRVEDVDEDEIERVTFDELDLLKAEDKAWLQDKIARGEVYVRKDGTMRMGKPSRWERLTRQVRRP